MSGVLTFNQAAHAYFFDGLPVPSVTQVLEACGVVDYSYLPPSTREMALARGSAVHLTTQYDDEGDLDEALLDDELRPYLDAWRRFRLDTGFTPDLIEHRGYHPLYRYAGTLDRRGSFPDGTTAMVDVKTNSSQGWVRLQLAAYCAFFPNPRTYRRICVEVHKDATYRAIEFPMADYSADFARFVACVAVYGLQRTYGRLCPQKERSAA
jgi:hypothetical protein